MGVDKNAVVAKTIDWVRNVVVGQNLCPFARRVLEGGNIQVRVHDGGDAKVCLQILIDEVEDLLQKEDGQRTTLLVLTHGFSAFDDYLDLVAFAEDLLEDLSLENSVQLASFHPAYQFEGSSADDVANYTNRSPFPMLHLLQVPSVSAAVDAHPDPDSIPNRNIELLQGFTTEEFEMRILRFLRP